MNLRSSASLGQIRLDVRQDGVLAEVELDHPRHEIIHHLVVGHARADGVGEADLAVPVGVDDARHAQH